VSWTTAVADLRALLSDGPTDKLRQKRVLGNQDGVRTKFKTFEFRRVTDFTTATAPLGVFVDGTAVTVSADDVATGAFTLAVAPTNGQEIEARYYMQWFIDSELQTFLRSASQWLGLGATFANVPAGLQPSALQYAAADAYQKLALRWAEHQSETYRLEDQPDGKLKSVADQYRAMSTDHRKLALSNRDEFYKRQGQALQPLFRTIQGNAKETVPQR